MEQRVNKFISDSGYASRREADRLIESGKVTINGKVATLGDKITPKDKVCVNGNHIECDENYVYLALNKPVGITSTTDPSDKTNVVDFVGYPTRIFHIGRLDKDSEGLLLLTNDGDIVNKILRAGNNHEKEYEVWVDKPIDNQFAERMSAGIKILGTVTKPCKVTQEGAKKFRIVLTQGLNRQIRRMCEALGYEVTRLRRVRIMNIQLAPLATGQWRELEPRELKTLFASLEESDSSEKASQGAGAGKASPKPANRQSKAPSKSAPARPKSGRGGGASTNSFNRPGSASKPGGSRGRGQSRSTAPSHRSSAPQSKGRRK